MSLVIVGSMAFDTIETPNTRMEKIIGGSCSYSALAASYFTAPKIVSIVGRDFPGDVIDFFRGKGIGLEGLEITQGITFHWEGRYGDDPNQRTTIRTDLNVFNNFQPELPPSYKEADIIFLGNLDPDQQEGILEQARNPRLVAMDTIKLWIESKPETLMRVLKKVNVFFCNDEEAKLITGEKNLIKAGKKLLDAGPSVIAVKKGEHGAVILNDDYVCGIPAHPTEEVVDPTGAGDCFAGGFLGYLDKIQSFSEKDIRRASVFGSILASFAIEDFGIERFKSLSLPEIEDRFAFFKKLVSF